MNLTVNDWMLGILIGSTVAAFAIPLAFIWAFAT